MIGSILTELARGFSNSLVPVISRSIIWDLPYHTKPSLDKLLPYIPNVVELLIENNRDKELSRQHEREMIEKMLKGRVIALRAEERSRLIDALEHCIESANTHEEKMAYLELYYRLTKEPYADR